MGNHFTIKIPSKPYVKAYLENNCGNPVNLQMLPDIQMEFTRCLRRKQLYREVDPICKYIDTVTVIIPPSDFYRYGWEINKEGIRDFNRIVELRAKFVMRQFIIINSSLGIPVATCIKNFQEVFSFPEHIWPYESIKKDYQRHILKTEVKIMKDLKREINRILVYNLSDLGTISKKLKTEIHYE